MLFNFNASLLSAYNASQAGKLKTLNPVQWSAMNETVQKFGAPASKIMATKGSNTFVRAEDVVEELKAALGLYQNNTVFTLGQVRTSQYELGRAVEFDYNFHRSWVLGSQGVVLYGWV
jgi:hypothetical protein